MLSVQTLVNILGLAVASGVNLYAAVLVTGLSLRYGWFSGLPAELQMLAHPAVLITAGVLYALEFFADKVPFLTPVWDFVHTFIRPLGAALLALGAVGDSSPLVQTLAFLVGGSLALGTHSTKASLRLLAHASPEPASHSLISLLEDFGVVALLLLAYSHPWIALAVLAVLLAAMALLAPLLLRTLRFLVRVLAGRLASWTPGIGARQPLPCPGWLEPALAQAAPERGEQLFRCFARSLRRLPRFKAGYLVRTSQQQLFACRRWFRPRLQVLEGPLTLRSGAVFDALGPNLYLAKDWSRVTQAFLPVSPTGKNAWVTDPPPPR